VSRNRPERVEHSRVADAAGNELVLDHLEAIFDVGIDLVAEPRR
jgi:hypothetical protein